MHVIAMESGGGQLGEFWEIGRVKLSAVNSKGFLKEVGFQKELSYRTKWPYGVCI